jgi:uncharacterized protein
VFTQQQVVGDHRFCTEFVRENAKSEAQALRDVLAPLGDSLIVAGSRPLLKVHLHTARPGDVQTAAAKYGTLSRLKIEDMAKQHRLLLVDAAPQAFSVVAVVPGAGFERIARELGADVTVPMPRGANPSVEELLIGVNATLTTQVYLLANDPNVALAAREVAALTEKCVTVLPTRDVVRGLAVLLALSGRDVLPAAGAIDAATASVGAAAVVYAGKDAKVDGVAVRAGAPAATIDGRLVSSSAPSLGGVLQAVVRALAADEAGVVTLYYGGKQKERDAQRYAAELGPRFPAAAVEYYFGGQSDNEYWVSFER